MSQHFQENADRFLGFTELYSEMRPKCPPHVPDLLTRYIGYEPGVVIDMGCGPAISTLVWSGRSQQIIGVEPNVEMIATARRNASDCPDIRFVNAFADDTGLESGSADVITCSQSFHWMEPVATLKEIARLLKPGGVFAAYDCDWPPVSVWQADAAFDKLYQTVRKIEAADPRFKDTIVRFDKAKHLQSLRDSGVFAYTREVLFSNTEPCDARRFVGIVLSQGSFQAILRADEGLIKPHLDEFANTVKAVFGAETHQVEFSYRMRLGIRK